MRPCPGVGGRVSYLAGRGTERCNGCRCESIRLASKQEEQSTIVV